MKTYEDIVNKKSHGLGLMEVPSSIIFHEAAIEFAKQHVTAALKEASKKAVIDGFYEQWTEEDTSTSELVMDEDDNYEGSYEGPVISGGKVFVVRGQSIVDSYPLTNIK